MPNPELSGELYCSYANRPWISVKNGTPTASVAGFPKGAIRIDISGGTPYYNSGTKGSATWSGLGAAAGDLDAAFDLGAAIDGANSSGNAVNIGDGTDDVLIYTASSEPTIATDGGADLTLAPAANLNLTPAGGDVVLTGTFAVSGTVTSTGNFAVGVNKFNVTASTGATQIDSTLNVDGNVTVATNVFSLNATTGSIVMAGTTGNLTVPGDISLTGSINGTFTGTFSGTFGATAWSAATITMTPAATTGDGVTITGDTVSSGNVLKIHVDGTHTGAFIKCTDVTTDKFVVATDGKTTITGTSSGTDAFQITAGDAKLVSGHVELTVGNVVLTDGNVTTANGVFTAATATDESTTVIRTLAATGSNPAVVIQEAHGTTTTPALLVNHDGTGASTGLSIQFKGTGTALLITPDTATTGTGLSISCVASTTVPMVVFDGATLDWIGAANKGLLDITCDGALAQTTTSCLRIAYSGAPAQATSLGTSLRVDDSGSVNTGAAVAFKAATGLVLDIDGNGTVDTVNVASAAAGASAFKITMGAATGTAIEVITAADSTVAALDFTNAGSAATGYAGAQNVGVITIVEDGTLAHTDASLVYLAHSGAAQASGMGTSLRINDSTSTDTSYAMYLAAATGGALTIAGSGTAADTISVTSAATSASALKITTEVATGTVLEAISAASATVSAVALTNSSTAATGWLGASNIGMLSLISGGNLADANASMLYIGYSGTGSATGLGTCLRIMDTGSTATSYAVYINSATGEALQVADGISWFNDQVNVTAGKKISLDGATAGSYLWETGGALTAQSDGDIHLNPANGGGGAVIVGDLTTGESGAVVIKGDDDGDNDPGLLTLYDDDGVAWTIWAKTDGTLRIVTGLMVSDADADGGAV